MTPEELEAAACTPLPIAPEGFNVGADLPYGLTTESIRLSMAEFIELLGFINGQLATRRLPPLESFLMPANFSSTVSEFMAASIPRHCSTVVRNRYHNGHPDLVPAGSCPGDAVQHGGAGVEIKASRYTRGWQGHNAEDVWLLVFVFAVNTSQKDAQRRSPIPFRFLKVLGAPLLKSDWKASGRSETSRRTQTASVVKSGLKKLV